MRNSSDSRPAAGFSLIELIVVTTIIAALSAIALPTLFSSVATANHTSAQTALKTIASAEWTFRPGDLDGNRVVDFWTANVSGLYTMTSAKLPGNAEESLRLIEVSLAGADSDPALYDAAGENRAVATFITLSPKSGYWYSALGADEEAADVYAQDTGGSPVMGAVHNRNRFGFIAYPNAFGTDGKRAFIVNESNRVFERDMTGSIRPSANAVPGKVTAPGYANWPKDADLKAYWK
jgi:prepilin-type N-terminal cleavage/methylation domain-containing protein